MMDGATPGFESYEDAIGAQPAQPLAEHPKGEVMLYTDRSATVQLRGQEEPALSCMGSMRYTSSTGGMVSLRHGAFVMPLR